VAENLVIGELVTLQIPIGASGKEVTAPKGVLEEDRPRLHESARCNRPVLRIQHRRPWRTHLDAAHRGWLMVVRRTLRLDRTGGLGVSGYCKHGHQRGTTESNLVSHQGRIADHLGVGQLRRITEKANMQPSVRLKPPNSCVQIDKGF